MEAKLLDEVVKYLTEDLGGDWLLVGGALVRLAIDPSRGTEDIDLVWIKHDRLSDLAAKNELYRKLASLGSGPEQVNSAVEPFLQDAPGWPDHLVELQRGRTGRILRPDLTLFTYLKLRRGTPIDLEDVRKAVAAWGAASFDSAQFSKWADPSTLEKLQKHRQKLGL